ncbi:unnamed protein product [Prunus brigantina]
MAVAHWFVLNNCDEIMAYLDEHEEMMKREHPSHLVARKHRELFPQWFLDYVNKLKASNSLTYSDELYNLAFGAIRAELFSGCGGESTDIDFYGKLTTVVQLLYKDRYQVIMFKCRWFDTNPNRSGSVKIDNGLLSVNINRTWYDDDPYILANMATQIVYLDDPKAGNGWKVVQKMDHRNVYAIPELDPTDNDVDNVADQRFESSMENDAETLRDTNVIQEPFQIQGVSSIEIPIQSITIDLGDLPRYDVAVGPRNDDDVVIEEEEEEDWETESDDSDDNESYYKILHDQANFFHQFKKPSTFSETYNPGWRNRPNLSWRNNTNNNVPQQKSNSFYYSPQVEGQSSSSNLEDVMKQFMQSQIATNQECTRQVRLRALFPNSFIHCQFKKRVNFLLKSNPIHMHS